MTFYKIKRTHVFLNYVSFQIIVGDCIYTVSNDNKHNDYVCDTTGQVFVPLFDSRNGEIVGFTD